MQQALPQQTGLGQPSTAAVAAGGLLGLAIAGAGAYGGYLVGGKLGAPKHRTAGKIVGAIAGWILVPAVVGTLLVIATAPTRTTTATPTS